MKTVNLSYVYIFLFCCICHTVILAQQDNSTTKNHERIVQLMATGQLEVEPSRLVVKLKEHVVNSPSFKVNRHEGEVKIGNGYIDMLNKKHGALNWKRVFPYAGKFEQKHRRYGLHLWYEITFSNGADLHNILQDFSNCDDVYEVEPILKKQKTQVSFPVNDPKASQQWHYENRKQTGGKIGADIDLFHAYREFGQYGDSTVIVSVHDEGINYNHLDLRNSMWTNRDEIPNNGIDDDNNGYIDDYYGYNFIDNRPDIVIGEHGSHVAGTIAATNDNNIGVVGIAGGNKTKPGARVMTCGIFGIEWFGDISDSYVYAADNGAVISQNSWGYIYPGIFNSNVRLAIDYFINEAGKNEKGEVVGPMNGGLVIFSAGNNNSSNLYYPGAYEKVVAVTATNHNDEKAYYSNYGEWTDIAAPGGDGAAGVYSTLTGNAYGNMYGTSMACPHVSGVAALLVSELKGSSLTPDFVKQILFKSAEKLSFGPEYEGMMGSGRLDAYYALHAVKSSLKPGSITDLTLATVNSDIALEWTVPMNDIENGVYLWKYDIRYDTVPIDEDNFSKAPSIIYSNSDIGKYIIPKLLPNTTYYVAIKSIALNGQYSDISNVASIKTGSIPMLEYDSAYVEMELGKITFVGVPITNKGSETLIVDFGTKLDPVAGYNVASVGRHGKDLMPHLNTSSTMETQSTGPLVHFPTRGNDDGFGYYWVDSWQEGGPKYEWDEISEMGTELFIGEAESGKIELPFAFPYYDKKYSSIYVSNTGIIGVDPNYLYSWDKVGIPNSSYPNGIIAAFWEDVASSSSSYNSPGRIFYYIDKHSLTVQYQELSLWFGSGLYTFQIKINDEGEIRFNYKKMKGLLTGASIGIESPDGDKGMQIAYAKRYVYDGMSVLIKKPTVIKSYRMRKLAIGPGETKSNYFLITSKGLSLPGRYKESFTITTNDPYQMKVELPFIVHIMDKPSIYMDKDSINFKSAYIGEQDSASFTVYNTSADSLSLSINSQTEYFVIKEEGREFDLPSYTSKTIMVYFIPESTDEVVSSLGVYQKGSENELGHIVLKGNGRIKPGMVVEGEAIDITLPQGGIYNTQVKVSNNVSGSYLNWKADIVPDYTSEETQFNSIEDSISRDKIIYISDIPLSYPDYAPNSIKVTYNPDRQKLYFISEEYDNSFYEFDLKKKQWKELSTLPDLSGSWDRDLIYLNGKVYVITGAYGDTYLYIYDINSDTWVVEKDPTFSEAYKKLVTDGEYIYALFGNWVTRRSEFWRYDPELSVWLRYNEPMFSGEPVEYAKNFSYVNGKLYGIIYFNYYSDYEVFTTYDIAKDKWEYRNQIPEGYYGYHGASEMVPSTGILYYFNNSWQEYDYVCKKYNYLANSWGDDIEMDFYFDDMIYVHTNDYTGFYLLSEGKLYFHETRIPFYWHELGSKSGMVSGNDSQYVPLTINTADLDLGTYYSKFRISGDDPDNMEVQIPIKVTVVEPGNNQRVEEKEIGQFISVNEGFLLYPNPAQNSITVMSNVDESANYSIVGTKGDMVQTGMLQGTSTTISVHGLQPGLYILQVNNGREVQREKFLIK